MHPIARCLYASLVLTATLAILACTQTKKPHADAGAVTVNSVRVTAIVKSIDYANRTITLQFPNGNTNFYHVSKNVVNFNQIKPNDRVVLTAAESVAVVIRPPGTPAPYTDNMSTVTLAPKGAKPGIVVTDTSSTTAQIVSIDHWNRKVTLKTPSGTQQVVKVASSVDLGQLKKGDDVIVRTTDNVAIAVETP